MDSINKEGLGKLYSGYQLDPSLVYLGFEKGLAEYNIDTRKLVISDKAEKFSVFHI